jgi:hypothetical protein
LKILVTPLAPSAKAGLANKPNAKSMKNPLANNRRVERMTSCIEPVDLSFLSSHALAISVAALTITNDCSMSFFTRQTEGNVRASG